MRLGLGYVAVAALLFSVTHAEAGSAPGWYGSALVGYNIQQDTELSFDATTKVKTDYKQGWIYGAALGREWGPVWFLGAVRNEYEISIRESLVNTHKVGGATLTGSEGNIVSTSGMVNLYNDFETDTRWVPYIGFGAGFSEVKFKNFRTQGLGTVLNDDDLVFAYQGMAGATYALTNHISIAAEYRYFATEKPSLTSEANFTAPVEYTSHGLLARLNVRF
ncbi:MAG: outer membrane protein [Holosporales bacterium]